MTPEELRQKTFVPKLPTQTGGMNLLEYFTGQAVIGLVGVNDQNPTDKRLEQIAKTSVKIAEYLIDELAKAQTPPEPEP